MLLHVLTLQMPNASMIPPLEPARLRQDPRDEDIIDDEQRLDEGGGVDAIEGGAGEDVEAAAEVRGVGGVVAHVAGHVEGVGGDDVVVGVALGRGEAIVVAAGGEQGADQFGAVLKKGKCFAAGLAKIIVMHMIKTIM